MSGLINWDDFCILAKEFLRISNNLNDNWMLKVIKDEPGGSFLMKRLVTNKRLAFLDKKELNMCCQGTERSTSTEPLAEVLTHEYQILFSISYNVPVLYFNIWRKDGSQLSLEDVWNSVPDAYRQQIEKQKWNILTQQEHPLLGVPFFMLHPCGTKDLMKLFSPKSDMLFPDTVNYLITWLSTVGPVAGLCLPLKYSKF